MKSLNHVQAGIVIVILMLSISRQASAQQTPLWHVSDASAGRTYINDALAIAGKNDLALASFGSGVSRLIFRSTDGGITWVTILDQGMLDNWKSIAHPIPELLMVVGDSTQTLAYDDNFNAYYKYWSVYTISTDGGATWSRQLLDSNTRLLSISMIDEQHGIIYKQTLGNLYDSTAYTWADSLLVTEDGWQSYRSIVLPSEISFAYQSLSLSPDQFLILAYDNIRKGNYLYRSTDGGTSWQSYTLPNGIRAITFIDPLHGWGAGAISAGVGQTQRDVVARTTDGGATWSTLLDQTFGKLALGLTDVAFTDMDNGIAVGGGNKIIRTTNGGETWVQELPPSSMRGSAGFGWVTYPTVDRAVVVSTVGPIIYYKGEQTLSSPDFIKPENPGPHPIQDILIEWTPVTGATAYQIQIAPAPAENDIYNPDIYDDETIIDTTLDATSFVVKSERLKYWHHYFVRVRALNATQQGDWYRDEGSSLFFTQEHGAIQPPKIIQPEHESINQPTSVTVEWESMSGATAYDMQMGLDPYFITEVVVDQKLLTGTSTVVDGLNTDTEYYIRVRGHVGIQVSDWTSSYTSHLFRTTAVAGVTVPQAQARPLPFTIIPNPAGASALIVLHASTGTGGVSLALYNALGEKIRDWRVEHDRLTVPLATEDLPPGSYIVRLKSNGTVTALPLVIAR